MMAVNSVAVSSMLIMLMVFPEGLNCRTVVTQCGQDVRIDSAGAQHVMVNLTFSEPQTQGARCSWVIPAENSSMSSQVLLIFNDALSCENKVFTISEQNPDSGALSPLTVDCDLVSSSLRYSPVLGQPGFNLVVTFNTSSPLPGNLLLMHILPFMWTDDVCPRNERKVVTVQPGTKDTSETLNPGLLARFPDNLQCKWEFRSPDQDLVYFEIRSLLNKDDLKACEDGDHFTVTDGSSSSNQIIVPLCKDPSVQFYYASTTGSVNVTMVSDNSGGAYQSFYFQYWSVQSCPVTPLSFKVYVGENHFFKGSSFSPLGANQEQVCQWEITAPRRNVIKLFHLVSQDFQQNCHENKDYLLVDGRKVSLCDNAFPVWSEGSVMKISLHTSTTDLRRSFMLNFTSVFKTACQGFPQRRNVTGRGYMKEYVSLMPISSEDVGNGPVCQWLFTAAQPANTVEVSVDWAEAGLNQANRGVAFNKETCTFDRFHVYSGDTANSSTEISPACSTDKSSLVYASSTRDMLFMYSRQLGVAEPGFTMDVSQVQDVTSGGRSGQHVVFVVLGTLFLGLTAFLLSS